MLPCTFVRVSLFFYNDTPTTEIYTLSLHDALPISDQLTSGVGELIDGIGKIHAVDFCGVDQALHVLAQAEDRRTLFRFVATDALEDRGAVTHDVRKDVQLSVVPVDPFSVVPDFLRGLNRHKCSLFVSATRRGTTRICRIRYGAASVNALRVVEWHRSQPNWRLARMDV